MIADPEDIDRPHIDWVCRRCHDSVYVSTGVPDTDHCPEGHVADWYPNDDQVETYIERLESLSSSDTLIVCGEGPVPLTGVVVGTRDDHVVFDPQDSPPRVVRWDEDEHTIEWAKETSTHPHFRDVYHVQVCSKQFDPERFK